MSLCGGDEEKSDTRRLKFEPIYVEYFNNLRVKTHIYQYIEVLSSLYYNYGIKYIYIQALICILYMKYVLRTI